MKEKLPKEKEDFLQLIDQLLDKVSPLRHTLLQKRKKEKKRKEKKNTIELKRMKFFFQF